MAQVLTDSSHDTDDHGKLDIAVAPVIGPGLAEKGDVEDAHQYDPTTTIKPLDGWRFKVVVFTLLFGLFLSTVETSITATALVKIGEYFNDSFTTNWVVLGYLLSYMGFSVIFARLSDAIGRKTAILSAWFIFAVFSLASGLASSLKQLIVFRTIQGIGGSGLYSMTMIVIPQISPAKLWGIVSALIGATFACASIVGPVLGGVITQRAGWRWIYLFNAPAAAIIAIPFLLAWPKSTRRNDPIRSMLLTQVDVPGALLLLAASTLLIFALQQAGGDRYAWNSAQIIASLIISATCWILFFSWSFFLESGMTKMNMKPIFPLSIARQRPTGPAILMSILTGLPLFTVIINLPIRFQLVNGDGPIMAGVHLMPLLAASAVGSALGGMASSKKNITSYCVIVSAALMSIGTGLLSSLPTSHKIDRIQFFYQAILGLGVGIGFSSITVMITLANNSDNLASANGAIAQGRVLGGSIGLAIATVILNRLITHDLTSFLSPTELHNLQKSLNTVSSLTPIQQAAVGKVFAKSFNDQMRVCLYISLASLFVAAATWQKNPPSVQEHQRVQAAIAKEQEERLES